MTAGNAKYFPKFSNVRSRSTHCAPGWRRSKEGAGWVRNAGKIVQLPHLISVPKWASCLLHSTTSSLSPSSNLAFRGMADMGQFPLRMDWNLLKLFLGHRLLHFCGRMKNLARSFSHRRQWGKFLVSIECFGKSWYIGNCLLSLDSRLALFLAF